MSEIVIAIGNKISRIIRNTDENAAFLNVAKFDDLKQLDRDLNAVIVALNRIKGLRK